MFSAGSRPRFLYRACPMGSAVPTFLIPVTAMSAAALNILAAFPNPTASATCALGTGSRLPEQFRGIWCRPVQPKQLRYSRRLHCEPDRECFRPLQLEPIHLSGHRVLVPWAVLDTAQADWRAVRMSTTTAWRLGHQDVQFDVCLADFRFGYLPIQPDDEQARCRRRRNDRVSAFRTQTWATTSPPAWASSTW